MGKKVVILGGLGNGVVIANAIKSANRLGIDEWNFEGFLNDRTPVGENIDDYPVLGKVSDSKKFLENGYYFINTILRIDGQQERLNLFSELGIPDEKLAIFVHPTAFIAPNVKLSPGTVIMPQVSVSTGVKFGKSCLVMVGAIFGPEIVMGDFCHIAAQSCIGSKVVLGTGVHIGLNSTIYDDLHVGNYATVGMGAVLYDNVGESEIWAGNPAKFLRMAT
ncbi:MAG: hypothetical protein LBQ22_07905 [Bacteroidales bacterium]|jgi:sugar O-acyltransferase (sialic acid O-acetyltransferase NeuD family)|nr:hypothetical protein [Bacteroidales bacterium]